MAVHGRAAGAGRRAAGGRLNAEQGELLAEIRAGLSQPRKTLPSKLFYDARGSELFEEITRLPEYYLTGTERVLLEKLAVRWMTAYRPRSVVELGAGNASKARILLDPLLADGNGGFYVPVDISADFLDRTAERLRREYPGLVVVPIAADFSRSLSLPPGLPRPMLVTFLGSTIGNFTAPEATALLRRIRTAMGSGDRFLLGADLRKNKDVLEAAYNDARGVTAEFNLNTLRVLNTRFGADFEVEGFRHHAFYDESEHRIEMHLVSIRPQSVHIPGTGDFQLREGESIRTEISCKYDRNSVAQLFASAGLEMEAWVTDDDTRFALALGATQDDSGSPVTRNP